jgi:hypothetical protein
MGVSEAADELFLMTNLFPATTGLPMVIWVGPSYGVRHDVRIKVMMAHGMRMDPGNLAVVAVRPTPHLVAGQLSASDLRAVSQWIALNEAAILEHWDGLIDGAQLVQRLQPLPTGGSRTPSPPTPT